jgi:hypothetical protein
LYADHEKPALQPLPPTSNNPYRDAELRKQIQHANTAKLAKWQETLKLNHSHLAQVRAEIKKQTDLLRQQAPEVDTIGTDIYGALLRSQEWFEAAAQDSDNILIIAASDLKNTIQQQQDSKLRLPVKIRVLFHVCDDVSTCQATNAFWLAEFRKDGATDIVMLDPPASAQAPLLP